MCGKAAVDYDTVQEYGSNWHKMPFSIGRNPIMFLILMNADYVFMCFETANKTITFKNKNIVVRKKQRKIVCFIGSENDGSVKLTPLVFGKFLKPRSLKTVNLCL